MSGFRRQGQDFGIKKFGEGNRQMPPVQSAGDKYERIQKVRAGSSGGTEGMARTRMYITTVSRWYKQSAPQEIVGTCFVHRSRRENLHYRETLWGNKVP